MCWEPDTWSLAGCEPSYRWLGLADPGGCVCTCWEAPLHWCCKSIWRRLRQAAASVSGQRSRAGASRSLSAPPAPALPEQGAPGPQPWPLGVYSRDALSSLMKNSLMFTYGRVISPMRRVWMSPVQYGVGCAYWGSLVIELILLAQLARLLCHHMRSCVSLHAVLRHRFFFFISIWLSLVVLVLF